MIDTSGEDHKVYLVMSGNQMVWPSYRAFLTAVLTAARDHGLGVDAIASSPYDPFRRGF